MITSFKIFENDSQFKVGDYVFVNLKEAINAKDPNFIKFAEYLKNNISEIKSITNSGKRCMLLFYNVPRRKIDTMFFIHDFNSDEYYIIVEIDELRLATPEESEKFIIKRDMKKYNL